MPDEQQQLDWQKVMEIGARSLGGDLATIAVKEIIGQMFATQNDTQTIITNAIEEICNRLTKIIDNAFIQQYKSDTDSIASRLLIYEETNDVNILDEILAESSNLVHRLKPFDSIEAITTLNYICNLHLVCIKAMAEHNPSYFETLKRVGKEFANISEPKAQLIIDQTKSSIQRPFSLSRNNLKRPEELSMGYRIEEIFLNTKQNKLFFYTFYFDDWSQPNYKQIFSEPILISKEMCQNDPTTSFKKISINNWNQNVDKFIDEELEKFNLYASQKYIEHHDQRMNLANSMKDTIVNACNCWRTIP